MQLDGIRFAGVNCSRRVAKDGVRVCIMVSRILVFVSLDGSVLECGEKMDRTIGISSLPEAIHMTLTPVEDFPGAAGIQTANACYLMNQ